MKRYLYLMGIVCCLVLPGCDDDHTVSNEIPDDSENVNPDDSDKTNPDDSENAEKDDKKTDENSEQSDPTEQKVCDPECGDGLQCEEGECVSVCSDDLTYCSGECLNLGELHLADCNTCEEHFCDADENLVNGCEIDVMASDADNCGACGVPCGDNKKCDAGKCVLDCNESQTACGETCVNLTEQHLSTCEQCADGYDNCNNDLSDGCEIAIKADDANNCGACGNICGEKESCVEGKCKFNSYSRMIIADGTPFLTEPVTGSQLTPYPQFEYCQVLAESNDWYQCEYNGQTGWVPGWLTIVVCDDCPGRAAITEAEKYLYSKTQKCTYDMLGTIPNLSNVGDYDNNCANFVTAILQTVGLMNYHTTYVQGIIDYCSAGNEGYHEVAYESGQAGDIWTRRNVPEAPGYSHAELVVGTYLNTSDNLVHMITLGSTNFSSCDPNAERSGSFQRVVYTDRNQSAQPGARIWSRQH